jgi:hypothetical protein
MRLVLATGIVALLGGPPVLLVALGLEVTAHSSAAHSHSWPWRSGSRRRSDATCRARKARVSIPRLHTLLAGPWIPVVAPTLLLMLPELHGSS